MRQPAHHQGTHRQGTGVKHPSHAGRPQGKRPRDRDYCDKDGYIQGAQLRLDHGKMDGKYRWFSSRDFENGTGARSWVHIAGDTSCTSAVVTEGALKGDVASYFSGEALFVCVPGVKSIGCLGETLSSLGIRKVFGAYDMDMYQNLEVLKDMARMRKLVLDMGIAYEPYQWNPRFKGVDDYLFARDNYLKQQAV